MSGGPYRVAVARWEHIPGERLENYWRRLDDGAVQRRRFFPLALERQLDRLLGALSLETACVFSLNR